MTAIRQGLPLVVLVALAALALDACASAPPLRLESAVVVGTPEPGVPFRVEAAVVNRTRNPVRIAKISGLEVILECRRAEDPPGSPGIGVPTSVAHELFGGVTDVRPDPADAKFCRRYPLETIELGPGERLPQTVLVDTPLECVAGKASLDLDFEAQDDGRACPGHWIGRLRTVKLPVEIRATSSVR